MKLRYPAILLAFAVASAVANAQAGLYATFSAEQFTRNGLLANPPAGSSNSDSPWLYGPTVGAFYTVNQIPKLGKYGHLGALPIGIGLDGRGQFLHGSLYSQSNGIISLRLTPKTPLFHTVPYIQGGAGIGHTKLPHAATFTNNLTYQFAIGVDRKLKGRMDWRVIEAGAGFLGQYVAGTNVNQNNYNITLSSGLVVRLGGK